MFSFTQGHPSYVILQSQGENPFFLALAEETKKPALERAEFVTNL
jgi:hypothetical protein